MPLVAPDQVLTFSYKYTRSATCSIQHLLISGVTICSEDEMDGRMRLLFSDGAVFQSLRFRHIWPLNTSDCLNPTDLPLCLELAVWGEVSKSSSQSLTARSRLCGSIKSTGMVTSQGEFRKLAELKASVRSTGREREACSRVIPLRTVQLESGRVGSSSHPGVDIT